MAQVLTTIGGKLRIDKSGRRELVLSDDSSEDGPCCCPKCPCAGAGSTVSGPQFAVSGLLFGGRAISSWFDTPFTGPDPTTPGCDQDVLPFGGYGPSEISEALAGAIGCTFDGFALKDGAVACFFSDEEQQTLSAIAIGPVIVNNVAFQGGTTSDGTPASANTHPDYTMYWANLAFIVNARYIKICPHSGFDGTAPIIFKPETTYG